MWKKVLIGIGIGLVGLVVLVGAGFRILMMGRSVFGWFGGNSPRGLAQNLPIAPMMRGFKANENDRSEPGMMGRDFGPGMMDRNSGKGSRTMPGWGQKQGFGSRGQQFTQQDLVTQDATVKQADANLVLIQLADGTSYAIQQQVLWYVQGQGLTMKAGDTLKVTGYSVKVDGTHTAYQVVKLADSSGKSVDLPGIFGRP